MSNCTVVVTYYNKIFVATSYNNNIFCYNKVFLIMIKYFIVTKLYCNEIFVAMSIAIDFTIIVGNKKLFIAIEVYCNNLKFFCNKKFRCSKAFLL